MSPSSLRRPRCRPNCAVSVAVAVAAVTAALRRKLSLSTRGRCSEAAVRPEQSSVSPGLPLPPLPGTSGRARAAWAGSGNGRQLLIAASGLRPARIACYLEPHLPATSPSPPVGPSVASESPGSRLT